MSAVCEKEPKRTLAEWAEIMRANSTPSPFPDHSLDQDRPRANGYVYFVQMGETGPIKIGFSINVQRRLESLQSCNPEQLHLRLSLPGSVWDEEDYQGDFHRSRIRGEWFEPSDDLVGFIREFQDDEDEADAA